MFSLLVSCRWDYFLLFHSSRVLWCLVCLFHLGAFGYVNRRRHRAGIQLLRSAPVVELVPYLPSVDTSAIRACVNCCSREVEDVVLAGTARP